MVTRSALYRLGLLVMLFIVGFVLMGYEMLGSRYLNPYFGSGITTWASLISVVLLSMMIGYFFGGYWADRQPGILPLGIITLVAGCTLIILAYTANPIIEVTMDALGDGFLGVLSGALVISIVPVLLLSACSPFVVRLMLTELSAGGRVTGTVYAVSTFGNVIGTLVTTFWLIPALGTRSITKIFGAILIALAIILILQNMRRVGWARVGIGLVFGCFFVGTVLVSHSAADTQRVKASYPEGPLWADGRLLVAEMGADRVSVWRDNELFPFWFEQGCGPTSVARYKVKFFAVNCHRARTVVILDSAGEKVMTVSGPADGKRFQHPNDINDDGHGGVFFSDPGQFALRPSNLGGVYRLSPDGRVSLIASDLAYPNGVAYDKNRRALYVSEHLAQRVVVFQLDETYSVQSKRIFLSKEEIFGDEDAQYALSGPDGLRLDEQGNLFVAIYGAGLLLVVSKDRKIHRVRVPMPFVTSVALKETQVAIVGAHDNSKPPFLGEVIVAEKSDVLQASQIGF